MLLLAGGWVGLKTFGHFSPFLLDEAEVTDRTPAWPHHICHANWCVSWGMSLAPTHPFLRRTVDWECGGLGHPISTVGAEARSTCWGGVHDGAAGLASGSCFLFFADILFYLCDVNEPLVYSNRN